jgi:hypothetical protein
MTRPTIPTIPPATTLVPAAELGLVEAEAAVPLETELTLAAASEAEADTREGPEPLEGLAIVDPVVEGP